jgi:hypothetical protein
MEKMTLVQLQESINDIDIALQDSINRIIGKANRDKQDLIEQMKLISVENISFEELQKISAAWSFGRLRIFPCTIGDIRYAIDYDHGVVTHTVTGFSFNKIPDGREVIHICTSGIADDGQKSSQTYDELGWKEAIVDRYEADRQWLDRQTDTEED